MAIPAILGLGGFWIAVKGFFLGASGVVATITLGQLFLLTIKKVILLGLIFVAFPLMIYRTLIYLMEWALEFGLTWITDTIGNYELGSEVLELSGIGGYIATQINLIEAFTIFITGHIIRMTINLIPETINPLRR